MRIKWTEETSAKVISNSVILIIAITFYFLVKNIGKLFDITKTFLDILSPFVIGFVISYLLTRPVNMLQNFLNRFLFKKVKKQHSINRAISIVLVILLVLAALTLVIYSIIPQLVNSVSKLAVSADAYIRSINTLINQLIVHFDIDAEFLTNILGSSQDLFKKLTEYTAAAIPKVLDFSFSIGSGISNFFIGFIISIYMLSGKERFAAQIKKTLFALFPKKLVDEIISTFRYAHETFGKYITGQLLDSILLGTICFILMSVFNMDYALLISMIITLTNCIPFIGPIIGAVLSSFILFMVQPTKALWFIIMIIILQQIDGNILVPRIVGKTIGLSSFWVIFAILVGGGMFGFMGVILAVPAFSVIHSFVRRFIKKQLRKKGLSTRTSDYYTK